MSGKARKPVVYCKYGWTPEQYEQARHEVAAETLLEFSRSIMLQQIKPILVQRHNETVAHLEELLERLGSSLETLEMV